MQPGYLAALAAALLLTACAGTPQRQGDGVDVGEASSLRTLIPAAELEKAASLQYGQLKRAAADKDLLAPDNHPQVIRLRGIAKRILPNAARFNPEARNWQWEVNLIISKQLNAFCMPGGKIAFYSGIIDNLTLSDDEIAIVMGHEIAHALREHAREQMAKNKLTQTGAAILGALVGGGELFRLGGNLMTLKFSRDDESEADLVGLDLAARAGYDPRAGITLWQKMDAAGNGAPPAWLSTHPGGEARIAEIERNLPAVMPLYEAARKPR
ncbi:M48 family metallopeptidase [Dechloromonas hortensis]|uniref:M48 family metallopeptidase n=1 Tax=Dechloromonas hortensis TaxID=337779 RepID=UPI0012913E12|nr:M48 family metallopeptidase [Dechloromonas hortensis]